MDCAAPVFQETVNASSAKELMDALDTLTEGDIALTTREDNAKLRKAKAPARWVALLV